MRREDLSTTDENRPGPLRVWRPRRQGRTDGEVFHEAIGAARPFSFRAPEVPSGLSRALLAATTVTVSVAVLGLSIAELVKNPVTAPQSSEVVESPPPAVPAEQPSTAQLSDEGAVASSGEAAQSTGGGEAIGTTAGGSGGGGTGGTGGDANQATTTPNTDPMVLVETPLGTQCLRLNLVPLEWRTNTKGSC